MGDVWDQYAYELDCEADEWERHREAAYEALIDDGVVDPTDKQIDERAEQIRDGNADAIDEAQAERQAEARQASNEAAWQRHVDSL